MTRFVIDSEQAAIRIDDMKKTETSIQIIRDDVTVRENVDKTLKNIFSEHPVRDVVHAAMILKINPSCNIYKTVHR